MRGIGIGTVGLFALLLTGCGREARVTSDRAYPGLVPEDQFITDLVLRGGVREMTDADWNGLDTQASVGLAWAARREGWPLAIAGSIDLHQAEADDDRGDPWESTTWELALGAQRTDVLGGGFMLSYGLGAAYDRVIMSGPADYRSIDWAVGGYGQAGVGYLVDGWAIAGITARFSETTMLEFSRAQRKIRAGALQVMGILGVRF